jgi:hypothetical protein
LDNNTQAFLALMRAGLWEREVQLSEFPNVDYNEVYRLAEEQSVLGLVAAGLEHVPDVKVPQDVALTFVGYALQLEQRNTAMNQFLSVLCENIYQTGLSPILIKGQGIAQCYERPLWRASGDIDLLFSIQQYEKAKEVLAIYSTTPPQENLETYECCFTIQNWVVEIHGSLHCLITQQMDRLLGFIQEQACSKKNFRIWKNGSSDIVLPSIDDDIIVIFTHIIKHFFRGGIGMRQICDLCRLLWNYKNDIDRGALYRRLVELDLITEWKAFASLAVDYMGLCKDSMPLYDASNKWKKKADRIFYIIMKGGNFGHNRNVSYQHKYPILIRKAVSLAYLTSDSVRNFFIFPADSVHSWVTMIMNKLK